MSTMFTPLLALMLSATAPEPVIETKPAFFHSRRPKAAETEGFDAKARSAARLPAAARHALPALSRAERAELDPLGKLLELGHELRRAVEQPVELSGLLVGQGEVVLELLGPQVPISRNTIVVEPTQLVGVAGTRSLR